MRARRRIALLLAATALAAASLSYGAEGAKPPGELQKIRGEISTLRKQLDQLNSRARTAEEQIRAFDLEIGIQAREIELASNARVEVARRRELVAGEVVNISRRMVREKEVVARRVSELYRLGGMNYWRILLSIDHKTNPLEAISMLSYLVARDARDIARFRASEKNLAVQQRLLAQEEARLDALSRQIAQRNASIAASRAGQERLLADLNVKQRRSTARLAELEEKARRLERLFELLYNQDRPDARHQPITSFRGALDWPIRGEILESFGRHRSQNFATYTMSNGMKISSPPNAPVKAVFAGTVLYAQWFKGYGNLIIVDHGERVFTLYGNTRMSMVKPAERVAAGQTIATVNEDEEGKSGYLYFEVRQNNKPVDPRKWLR